MLHYPAVHLYMHEKGGPRSGCGHPSAQKRPAIEAKHRWRHRPERRAPRLELPGPGIFGETEEVIIVLSS